MEMQMAVELEGIVAFITGGARGIGLSIAEFLAREGASVFICGRDPSRVESSLVRLRNLEGKTRADGTVADVRRYADCHDAIQRAAERFGRLDCPRRWERASVLPV
jgi:NAD(P)-dependent dehydrogenase (short-subunit alcohol dehydrogenase family)